VNLAVICFVFLSTNRQTRGGLKPEEDITLCGAHATRRAISSFSCRSHQQALPL
jgi:hypothetical protein